MRRIRDLICRLFVGRYGHQDADQARERLAADQRRADKQANRIDKGARELERRVYEVNHLTEAVHNLWRQR